MVPNQPMRGQAPRSIVDNVAARRAMFPYLWPWSPAPSMLRLHTHMKMPVRLPFAAAIISIMAFQACAPIVDQRGNLPLPEALAQIKPGKTSEDEVMSLLGSPSTTMNYGEETWHYVSSRTETMAFFKPEEKERTVISISFDKAGKVKELVKRTLADGQTVETVSRETPTAGKEMSALEQLLGNVGKFSKDAKGK
jgi:outer membrane protein assembly factor BamE (lipoprotein component of BamABCDE complex)